MPGLFPSMDQAIAGSALDATVKTYPIDGRPDDEAAKRVLEVANTALGENRTLDAFHQALDLRYLPAGA